jgi:hypothetical protein
MILMHKAIAAGAPYAENTAWCRTQLTSAILITCVGIAMIVQALGSAGRL